MIKIICPSYIQTGVKKKRNNAINLNQYRNWCFQLSNNLKIRFKEIIDKQLDDIDPIIGKISITFTYFSRTKQLGDLDNKCSIVNKFLQDALVEKGIIKEDNCNIIDKVKYQFGGIDKENPRVEAEIIPYDY